MIGGLASEGSIPRKLPGLICKYMQTGSLQQTLTAPVVTFCRLPILTLPFAGIQLVFCRNQQKKILMLDLWVFEPPHLLYRHFLLKVSVAALSKQPRFYSGEILFFQVPTFQKYSFRNTTVKGIIRVLQKEVEFSSCVFHILDQYLVFESTILYAPN